MISLRTHSILDYMVGGALILCPFLFGFADLDVARNLFVVSGFFIILYSMFTNYDYAVVRAIPLGVHMTLDVLVGAWIFIAPWAMGYRDFLTSGQELLHYALGIAAFALVGVTREKTEADRRQHTLPPRQPVTGRL